MSNLELIQKLTYGIEDTETVVIELDDGTKEEAVLRPLTDGELTKLQVLEKKPYTMRMKMNRNGEKIPVEREDMIQSDDENEMDISMGDFTESQAKALYTAVAWSLSADGESVSVKAVEGMRKGVPELLFKEVIRISCLTESDLTAIKNFRGF